MKEIEKIIVKREVCRFDSGLIGDWLRGNLAEAGEPPTDFEEEGRVTLILSETGKIATKIAVRKERPFGPIYEFIIKDGTLKTEKIIEGLAITSGGRYKLSERKSRLEDYTAVAVAISQAQPITESR